MGRVIATVDMSKERNWENIWAGMTRIGDLWKAYNRSSLGARLRVISRYILCPYESLVKYFPDKGKILDVGCGDGIMLVLLSLQSNSTRRQCVGIDHAEDKIAVAKSAQIHDTTFLAGDLMNLPSDAFDCISIVDVLYCVPLVRWRDFLGHCTRILRKNGLLIIKEVIDKPRWKYWLSYIEEVFAIKVFKMTKGETPHLESIETYRSYIELSGANVFHVERLDAWRPYAHCLFLARKT